MTLPFLIPTLVVFHIIATHQITVEYSQGQK